MIEIAVAGLRGSGKTHAANIIAKRLRAAGYTVFHVDPFCEHPTSEAAAADVAARTPRPPFAVILRSG